MYLRSRQRAAQGRHEHIREAAEASVAAACGRRDHGSSSSRAKGGTQRKAASCYCDLVLAPQPQPRPLRGGSAGRATSDLVYLKRGMSEGERAAITPRIGWRKLTDPGD
ncbi:hypothetical protein ALC57_09084 [Trachymyrmex cornetzi]|uniref:Uncharacterized protein n=1 Tax=Trachymyrmex cornetzi TaxID=471704 RepID=A0A151J5X6_9HYME|nr:hypothetical protein ALC57_09084 [Trachymyrmex cornetzi]